MDAVSFELIAIALAVLVGAIVFSALRFRTKKDPKELSHQAESQKPSDSFAKDLKTAALKEEVQVDSGAGQGLEPELVQPPTEKKVVKEEQPTPEPVKATKDLRTALENTRNGFWGRIKSVVSSESKMSDDEMENLEEVLYTSDLGPATVQRLVEAISGRLEDTEKSNLEKVQGAIRDEIQGIFSELEGKGINLNNIESYFKEVVAETEGPRVLMVVGVNGVGKTTTIGKLASKSAQAGLKTMVVAGDTFRAAAEDQLKIWADRAGVEVFSPEGVKDPSAVIFDGLNSAKSKDLDMVIVDTAGRLHTQDNLMEELKKMRRVMAKVMPEAPHEVLLVLDANSGQNALVQARTFHGALDIDGVVLTKLDGSAKGGVAVGIACELGLPIKLIGVGEGIDDLRPFESVEFVNSII